MSNGTATNQIIDELGKYLKTSIDDQYKVPNPLILRAPLSRKISLCS